MKNLFKDIAPLIRKQVGPITGPVKWPKKVYQWVQQKFADTLSRYEKQMSIPKKKRALLLFCVFMCLLSAYWILDGIYEGRPNTPSLPKRSSISTPVDIGLPDSLDTRILDSFVHWKHRDSVKHSN